MRVAVIADAHLGGPGGAAEPLVRQLEEVAASGCRHLVFLGDLFHVWVGHPSYETREVAAVVRCLRRLRREGLRVDYVEGNRDFFLAGSVYADAFDRIDTEIPFRAGDRRYLAVHGDGLDPSDRQYRFWRWLSKSALSRFLILHLPTGIARRSMSSTEVYLAGTNFQHRQAIPERAIREYAERRLAEGFDALLLGHFHEPRVVATPAGEVRLLDAWFRSRAVEWVGSEP